MNRKFLCVQVLAACGLALPDLAQKQPDVHVDRGGFQGSGVSTLGIVAEGSYVYLAWSDDRNSPTFDAYFNRSLDGGRTWLANSVNMSLVHPSPGGSMNPRLAVSGPLVCCVFNNYVASPFANDVYFNRSLDRGATWLLSALRIPRTPIGTAMAVDPQIAVDGQAVYVVWFDQRNGMGDVYFNRSANAGTTWLPADVRLNLGSPPGTTFPWAPQITVYGLSVYVVWADNRNGTYDIYCNASQDGGTTWLPNDVRINSTRPAASLPTAQIAASGPLVDVVWGDSNFPNTNSNQEVYFNCSFDGGLTWQAADARLSVGRALGTGSSVHPQLAAAGPYLYVAWQEVDSTQSSSKFYFNRSVDYGSTWLPAALRVDQGSPRATATPVPPTVSCNGPVVAMAWSNNGIRYNRSLDGGTTWLPTDVSLGMPRTGTFGFEPQLTDSGGSVYAAWSDSTGVRFNLASGHQPYGTGTVGTGAATPVLSGSGDAAIGGTISIDLSNGLGGALGLLAMGSGLASQVSQPLFGGTLRVSPTASQLLLLGGSGGTAGAGAQSILIHVPNQASLLGLNVNFQGLFLDSGAIGGVSMSNGLETWIG